MTFLLLDKMDIVIVFLKKIVNKGSITEKDFIKKNTVETGKTGCLFF